MNKFLLLFCLTLIFARASLAQTGISSSGNAPHASAMLDVIATDKGFLPPRVALLATNNTTSPISSPAQGLIVFNTATAGTAPNNVTPGLYYYDTDVSLWRRIVAGYGTFPTGSGTTNYVVKWTPDGATLGNSQIFDNGSAVGIGTSSPTNTLHLYRNGSTPVLQLYSDRSGGSSGPSQLMENRILFGGVNNQGWSTPNGAGIDFHTNYPAETSTGRLNLWAYPSTSASPNLTVWNGSVGIGNVSPVRKLEVQPGNHGLRWLQPEMPPHFTRI